ncbi:family 20 glycosylhydrolase [Colwellia sp. 20A7]|uniref:family 20 glycosylhydrolase n=1 Tax=Colwellia sp. 20A7 TaxID=2689569 RepID=UPI00135CC791|nr:family 20 glycosylhydrolase [Colwellia sp. 20A7]
MLKSKIVNKIQFCIQFGLLALCFISHQALASLAHSVDKSGASLTQQELNNVAQHLKVKYEVINNESGGNCLIKSPCYFIELTLSLPYKFTKNNWQLYFSQLNPLLTNSNDNFVIKRLEGDIKSLVPSSSFNGFLANNEYKLTLQLHGDHFTEYKPLGNYYLTSKSLTPALIKSTIPTIDNETGLETLPHVLSFIDEKKQFINNKVDKTVWTKSPQLFNANSDLTLLPKNSPYINNAIIPTPNKLSLNNKALIDLSIGINVQFNSIKKSGVIAALNYLADLGINESVQGVVVNISKGNIHSNVSGAYLLNTTNEKITITANDETGAFYALQSLASLYRLDNKTIPNITVEDQPRFPYRGMHLDVARNFHSKESVKQLISQMSAYKLNKLHLHLSDDEGWRLEIKDLPELTQIGGFRCHDLTEQTCLLPQLGNGPFRDSKVNGYFSINDYVELLTFAKQRHIEIIPSFDMPGHARAAIKSMEVRYNRFKNEGNNEKATEYLLTDFTDKTQYNSIQNYTDNTINVCLPSAYHFVEKVIDEVAAMHKAAGVPLVKYHLGGDESPGAWRDSPACAHLYANKSDDAKKSLNLGGKFIEKIANILADKNIVPAGWNDGMEHTNYVVMPNKAQSNIWALLQGNATELAHKHANQGWDVVLSLPEALYFDMPHEADPKERGYDWAIRELNSRKIFEFMPENLPIHAEFWSSLSNNDFQINDNKPLKKGNEYIGLQGHLWSEVIRSPEQAQYMIFPRLIVLAEKAWSTAKWEVPYNYEGGIYNKNSNVFSDEKRHQRDSAWNNFANVLGHKEFLKLDLLNIDYRLPTVGAKIINGTLKANISFPGLTIEYRIKDGNWQAYKNAVFVDEHDIEIRSVAANGLRYGRAIFVN